MKTRGIEPIVAAILLIVVAVIGAVLVYLWFSGFITRGTSQVEQLQRADKLKIEAASLDATGPTIDMYVRNLGSSTANVTDIYILDAGTLSVVCHDNSTIAGTAIPSGGVTIGPGQVGHISGSVPCTSPIASGKEYVIKIATEKGSEFAARVVAS